MKVESPNIYVIHEYIEHEIVSTKLTDDELFCKSFQFGVAFFHGVKHAVENEIGGPCSLSLYRAHLTSSRLVA